MYGKEEGPRKLNGEYVYETSKHNYITSNFIVSLSGFIHCLEHYIATDSISLVLTFSQSNRQKWLHKISFWNDEGIKKQV
jgi:membrane-bound metal-dependent hydrolase YbcI (DUF457 family)